MPLQTRPSPFDHAEYRFKLKYDGFRALAAIENGRCQSISRNAHPFASFADLATDIAAAIPNTQTVLNGEIMRLDKKGSAIGP